MSRTGLKALAGKLATDRDFKKRVLSGDEQALAGFDLSKEEREAVSSARLRLAMATPNGQMNTTLDIWV